MCVCSLIYPECISHLLNEVLYFHLQSGWPSSAVWLALTTFWHINNTIFGKKNSWTWNICFDFFIQTLLETFLTVRRIPRVPEIYVGLHIRYPLFLLSKLNFRDRFSKYLRISNFMEIGGAEFFHADRHPVRWTETRRSKWSIFAVFWTRLLKYFRADSHVRLLKLTDVSEAVRAPKIRDLILLDNRAHSDCVSVPRRFLSRLGLMSVKSYHKPDYWDGFGPRNVGWFQRINAFFSSRWFYLCNAIRECQ